MDERRFPNVEVNTIIPALLLCIVYDAMRLVSAESQYVGVNAPWWCW
jgi:hypothetical protein